MMHWLFSRAVREATDVCRQAQRLLNEQRDLLQPEAIQALQGAIAHLRESIRLKLPKTELRARIEQLELAASKWLRPCPNPSVRENVKEILVAITVILAITTFFLQLTKIPTGSLQPTLFGITYHSLSDQIEPLPGRLTRLYRYWAHGVSYFHVVAKQDGILRFIDHKPKTLFPFIRRQRFQIGRESYSVWFPQDELFARAHVRDGQSFQAGQEVLRMKVIAGDHLLVDRFTFNFRRPRRGEIIVFKTQGISRMLPENQLYIKRLVALENERVRIGDDNHLIIDGERLDASTPGFENVYSFVGDPEENAYFGHVNDTMARRYKQSSIAPLFPHEDAVHQVAEDHCMAMGDNTLNSFDSRAWGDVPRKNVTGKCWFVYWPITDRFGWGTR